MVSSSTLDATEYITTTNKQGSTVTYVPVLVTSTMVYTNSRGDPVTVTSIMSIPSLLPGDRGGGASAFFRNKAAVAGVFTTVGLVIVAIFCFLICYLRSRHKRRRLAYDNAVAAITEGRRSTGRLTLIDDDEDDGSYGDGSSTDRSASGHGRASTHSNYSSSNGRMSPIDSAGQMTSKTPFPPVSLLAASYNRRRSSSSYGRGGPGEGSNSRLYQYLRTSSGSPTLMEFGKKNSSSPPLFSRDHHRDPFSDPPSVTFLIGTKGGNRSPRRPATMDGSGSVPLTLTTPTSPSRAQRDPFAYKRELDHDDPFSSNTSLDMGAGTPKDWEVRNVFDEEFGSVPTIRRKPMLAVQNHS